MDTAKSLETAFASSEPAYVRDHYGVKIAGNHMGNRALAINKNCYLAAQSGAFLCKLPGKLAGQKILPVKPPSVEPFKVFSLGWRKPFDVTVYFCYFSKPLS